jgi:PmbA protein
VNAALRQALDAAARSGATACDALLVDDDALEAEVRAGELDRVVRSRTRVLSVRLFRGRRVACASTSDLASGSVSGLIERASALAEASADDEFAGPPVEAAGDEPALDLFCAETAALEPDDAIELARRADRAARDRDERIQASGQARCSVRSGELEFARSDGFRGGYRTTSASVGCMPVAEQGGEKQRDYAFRVACSHKELPPPEEIGGEAAERALRRLGARKLPSARAAVIYEPRTAVTLLRHLGDAVLGDAIAEKRSFLLGRIGDQVAGPAVQIVDDGRLARGLGSRPFDGEGVATRRNPLVENGRLRGYLLDSYTARRLGLETTGSARRPARGQPAPGTSNLILEPGADAPEAITAGTERGLIVSELIGFGVNGVTGDYSRGAAGLWVEDGRIQHAVQEVTVAGNLIEMLCAVDAIGDDLTFFGALGAPTVRVAEATIAGI